VWITVFLCQFSNHIFGQITDKIQENSRCDTVRETVWQPVDPGGHGWLTCGYIHPVTGHLFYSSDMGGSLLRSTDQGETWEPIANPVVGTAYSIVGDPKEPYTLYINQIGDMPKPSRTYDFGGGPKSWGIWKSTDNGDTWVQICNTDIFAKHISQSGVIDPDNNKIIYWTAADGGIQKSVDGGYSWLEISAGLDKSNIERY
ncbi:MAG: hypothetical protein KAU83_13340, partial [Bacteroidales bacterium]|nr:hypothetical protein [Bacteroidales bacterium]